MSRSPALQLIAKCVVTVGIILTLLLAGGAPSGHTNGPDVEPTPTTVAP